MSEYFNTGLYKIFEPKYKDIVGKPFITVSAKGISNGLSNVPNGGADFGPDTMLNATSPNQTGAPYSPTKGINESINYAINNHISSIVIIANEPIYINETVKIPASVYPWPVLQIYGIGGSPRGQAVIAASEGMTEDVITFSGQTPYGQTGTSYVQNLILYNLYIAQNTGNTGNVADFSQSENLHNFLFVNCTFDGANNGVYSLIMDGNEGAILYNSVVINGNVRWQVPYGNAIIDSSAILNNSILYLNAQQFNMVNSGLTGGIILMDNPNNSLRSFYSFDGLYVNPSANFLVYSNNNQTANVIFNNAIIFMQSGRSVIAVDVGSGAEPNTNIIARFTNSAIYSSDSTQINLLGFVSGAPSPNVSTIITDALTILGPNVLPSPYNSPISANPPVSGTVYQNTNPYNIRLKIPITYNPTASASATLATGISQTSTVTTSTKVSIPAGLTSADGQILTYDMVVPSGWYYELVATNATIGTAEVQPA